MTVTLEFPEALEHKLRFEAAKNGLSLDTQIVQNLTPPTPETQQRLSEVALLQKINLDLGISPAVWDRYDHLILKLRQEKITETERQEFIQLNELVETANVERLKYLVELSQLRHVTLQQTMKALGIAPRETPENDGNE